MYNCDHGCDDIGVWPPCGSVFTYQPAASESRVGDGVGDCKANFLLGISLLVTSRFRITQYYVDSM